MELFDQAVLKIVLKSLCRTDFCTLPIAFL